MSLTQDQVASQNQRGGEKGNDKFGKTLLSIGQSAFRRVSESIRTACTSTA
jgi:hypothetical protein